MTVTDIYKYNPDLQRIARWHSPNDTESARDAVQTFYLKMCEIENREGNLDRLFYKGSLNMVYVFTVIRNILIDSYRATKNLERLPEEFDCPATEPEADITTEEMCQYVRRELAKMREYDRLVTLAYYNEGHTIRSLAKDVGIDPTNIFWTLRRVKAKISDVIINNPQKFPKL